MILYTITFNGVIIDWAGTQAEAKVAMHLHRVQQPLGTVFDITWQEHNVPTDKPSLIAWLKIYAVNLGEEQVELIAEALHLETSPQPQSKLSNESATPILDQIAQETGEDWK